ncbi:cytochrome c [Aquisalimonas lutea]|uniref:c-type cytochrome n=1 Tax=Aquisalimonas lutea TaxID=1327750 RepID=UPI0025B2BE7F|nr:cytochrome c [Aquisalimonas lutea]MDN3519232.1 cytochrome c [Aquisalimonas lutea]
MMKQIFALGVGVAGLLLATSALAADGGDNGDHGGDPRAGREIAESQCMACHAVDGSQSNPQWPRLAGQHRDYLVEALRQYKEGERDNSVMQGQVSGLSMQELRNVAAYYSQLEGELYTPER